MSDVRFKIRKHQTLEKNDIWDEQGIKFLQRDGEVWKKDHSESKKGKSTKELSAEQSVLPQHAGEDRMEMSSEFLTK